jgi:hypothetical protein
LGGCFWFSSLSFFMACTLAMYCSITGSMPSSPAACTANHTQIFFIVKSVLSDHHGDPKLVAVLYNWPFRTNWFYRKCAAEGQKQTGRIRQMAVKSRWPLGQIRLYFVDYIVITTGNPHLKLRLPSTNSPQ